VAIKDFVVKHGLAVGQDAEINGTGAVKVSSGTTAERPVSPVNGMVRYNTDLNYLEQYSDSSWDKVGNAFIVISDTPPANPDQNDLWWDSTVANLFIYYDGAWIEASYNVGTNLNNTKTNSSVTITSSTGTDTTIVNATQAEAGMMSAADKLRLDTLAIDDLADVTITTATNEDLLKYDSATSQWVNTTDIVASSVQLSGGTGDQGTLTWNTDEETLDLNEGGSTLQIGQEVVYHVRNNTGSTIADGTPVMATGTLGASGRITIAPMDATNPANAKYYLGVTTEEIANDADGKVTHFGKVRGIDLSAYQEGDVLWLSTTAVGEFTATEPLIGTKIATAFVISNNNNGTMFVRATNSIGLGDLDDVSIGSPVLGEILYYDGDKFRNGTTVEAGILTSSDLANSANVEDVFTTNGSSTAFILSEAPSIPENILVSIDGVVQPTSSYSIVNTTLTISPAISAGSEIRVLHLKPLLAEAVKAKHTTETTITLTSANMNTSMTVTGDVTVNQNVGVPGDTVLIYNNSAFDVTVNQGTGVTLRLAGTETTGTRTLAGRGLATLFFVSTTEATLGGSGVS